MSARVCQALIQRWSVTSPFSGDRSGSQDGTKVALKAAQVDQ